MQKKQKRFFVQVSSVLFAVSIFIIPVFADVRDTNDAVQFVYKLVIGLAMPIAAISIAFIAFTLFSGSEQAIAKVPAQIRYMVFAVAGILLLALIINYGSGLGQTENGSDIAWNPSGGNSIVSDAVPCADLNNLVGINNSEDAETAVDGDAAEDSDAGSHR